MTDQQLDAVLCYVKGPWAYFTTCPLEKQWGDDWDDAPYEHNAGLPYDWADYRDTPSYEIIKIAFEGPFDEPRDHHLNSPFSVQAINRGAIAWLRFAIWDEPPDGWRDIQAGTTLRDFIRRLKTVDGARLYLPEDA